MGLKKATKRIEARIEFLKLLAEGQKNDGDLTGSFGTLSIIEGLQEANLIIFDESIDVTKSQKKFIKRANKYLSSDSDVTTLKMIIEIKNDYQLPLLDRSPYIDYLAIVQVSEKFENAFNSQEFLEQIGYL